MITREVAIEVWSRVAMVAERSGYIATLYGSTLLKGQGADIDILLSPVTPLAMFPKDILPLVCKPLYAVVERDAVGYYAHAFILRGSIQGHPFVVDLAIRYQNADEGHKRGWDEAQIFKNERFALGGGTEAATSERKVTDPVPLMEASDD